MKLSPSLPTVLTDLCAFQQGAALRRLGSGEGGGDDRVDATIAYVGRTHARKEQGTQLVGKSDISVNHSMDAFLSAGVAKVCNDEFIFQGFANGFHNHLIDTNETVCYKLSHSNSNCYNGFFDSPTLHSGNLGSCVAGNRQHQPPPPAAQELAMKGDGGDRGGGGWGSRSRCRCSSRRTDQFQRKSESGNTSEMVRVNQECMCEIFARERMQGERRRRRAGVRSRN